MTNPQEPDGDPSIWARPGPEADATHPATPFETPPTTPEQPAAPAWAPPPDVQEYPAAEPSEDTVKLKRRRSFGDPVSIVLVFVIVVALLIAGLIGTELYARHLADSKVTEATECVVRDNASVTFGVAPPFLWQHVTGHYTNISIETAGNQVKDAKLMKAELSISDVRLQSTEDSGGTIGALDARLTWPSKGIKETIREMVPLLGNLVSDVTTNPADGTVELKGAFGLATAVVKPQVVNNGLSLQVVSLTGLGSMALPKESVQPALDDFTARLLKKYPLGVHADSVEVTDTGVVGYFSTRNATIPAHSQDPCFANL